MISFKKMKELQIVSCFLAIGLIISGLTSCRGSGGVVDDIIRTAPKPKPHLEDIPVPKPKLKEPLEGNFPVSVFNPGTRRTYKITDVRQSANDLIATVDTINGIYQIAVDCRAGVISPVDAIQLAEKTNFIQDVCNASASMLEQLPLNLGGEWIGTLVGTSGGLNYALLLNQNGSQIEGTARAVDSVNPQRYVVFRIRGVVSRKTLKFEQYEIAQSSSPSDWCLIAGTLSHISLSNGEFLQGNWSTRSVNVNPACSGIVGQLNLQKR